MDSLVLKSYQYEVDEVIVSSEKVDYNYREDSGAQVLSYCRESRCRTYLIGSNERRYVSEEGDTIDLTLDQELFYKINSTDYRIDKLLLSKFGFDSQSFHYFSPEFGIILTKSKTWRDYSGLFSPADEKRNTLITVVINDQLSSVFDQPGKRFLDSVLVKEMDDELGN